MELDINLNKNEKKALFSFLIVYVGSTLLFLSLAVYTYYNKEVKTLDKQCSIEMISAAYQIRGDILKSYMNNGSYTPKKLLNPALKFGLFDNNNRAIFSQLSTTSIMFAKEAYETNTHTFHVHELNKKEIPIKYIVIETKQGVLDKLDLKHFIFILLIISAIFISLIGYLLSNLLLKPVREKINHMDKFIKDSAHELNTPISVLRTSVSMLKKGKNSEKMMQYINSSTKQISEAFNDLHFAVFDNMLDSMNTQFELDELCCESVGFFNDIAMVKNIEIQSNIEKLFVFMDRNKTQKLVNNLISNAIKYSNKNSKIIVSLSGSILSVHDFGIGISEEEQKTIFKRYERGTNNEGGFGIGLDIVSRICYEYDIILSFESQLKVGSKFILDFKNTKIS